MRDLFAADSKVFVVDRVPPVAWPSSPVILRTSRLSDVPINMFVRVIFIEFDDVLGTIPGEFILTVTDDDEMRCTTLRLFSVIRRGPSVSLGLE